jgi:hypothetical protein
MDRSAEFMLELRLLREELGKLRDEVFMPLTEINKNLHRLAEAAWVMVQLAKKEAGNGRDREK